ncbi:sensor histidine kinase [Sphingomonas sp. RB1R13]|uniref:sensor histidine kinase n=1 Tax=Sphingomonas sp. RB1R13 TaxID=3096159 RepID=UPI002FCB6450
MDAITSRPTRLTRSARLSQPADHGRSTRALADWPLATKSILAFWLVYGATVVARALLSGDAVGVIQNRSVTILSGLLLTFGIYLAIALIGRRRAIRTKVGIAIAASILAALAQSAVLMLSDSRAHQPQDEFRLQAREGVVIITKGDQVRIERHAAEPLIFTLPKIAQLPRRDIVRVAADASVVWLFFFAAWSAFYLAAQAQNEAAAARQRIAEAESAARTAQVRALRYQVNPHFLFNTLNSLSSLVLASRNAEAEAMILKLSAFFRSSLTLNPTADVSLADEIALQQHYLDIETVRFPKRLRVEIDIAPGLEHAQLPALLLQPVVENAIKYGVSATREKVLLTIAALREGEDRLTITVTNRGEGTARLARAAPAGQGTGVGLANVCARLKARFGDAASCRFGPLGEGNGGGEGGYEVTMTMPFEQVGGPA